jgi:pyruvate kinase
VSKWRPRLPIIALSSLPETRNRLNVLRGVIPLAIGPNSEVEDQLLAADGFLLREGLAEPGQPIVVAAAIPLGTGKETNTIRFHRVRDLRGPLGS